VAVTGDGDDEGDDARVEPAWHERTSTLVGASIAAVAVLALLYFLISTVVREFNEPEPAQEYFLDPGGSSSTYRTHSSSTTTTTQTVTSTSPPVTSDINIPGEPTTPSTTSGSETTTSPSSSPSTSRQLPHTTDNGTRTPRSRPRLNETRTLYPQP
jgi:cytoskeletal protein RodZ